MRLVRWSRLWLLLIALEVTPERSAIGDTLRLALIQTVVAVIIESDLYRFKRTVFTSQRAMGLESNHLCLDTAPAGVDLIFSRLCRIDIKLKVRILLLTIEAHILESFDVCIYLRLFVRVRIESILFQGFFAAGRLGLNASEAVLEEIHAAVSVDAVALSEILR